MQWSQADAAAAGNGGASIHGLRDAAIIAVTSDGMLRVSEMSALDVGDVAADESGTAKTTGLGLDMCRQTSVTVGVFGRRFRTEHMSTKTQPGMAPRGADEMAALQERIAALGAIQLPTLRDEWWRLYQTPPPRRLSRDLLIRGIAYKLQANAHGGLSKATQRRLRNTGQDLRPDRPCGPREGSTAAPWRAAGAAVARPNLRGHRHRNWLRVHR